MLSTEDSKHQGAVGDDRAHHDEERVASADAEASVEQGPLTMAQGEVEPPLVAFGGIETQLSANAVRQSDGARLAWAQGNSEPLEEPKGGEGTQGRAQELSPIAF